MDCRERRRRNFFLFFLGTVSTLFFLSVLVLSSLGSIYVSPDETANAFFANRFAAAGHLEVFEPLNVQLGDVLFPRSILSIRGWLVPDGFAGLPVLYGTVLKIAGGWILPFFTAALALASAFAWFALVKRIFSQSTAFWSFLFLLVHPAWWYYVARSLMPNVPFVSFLILGVFFLVVRPLRSRIPSHRLVPSWLDAALSGFCLGLSLFIRPSEMVWVLGSLSIGAILFFRSVSWKPILAFLFFFLVGFSPFFSFNARFYGNPLATGYTVETPPVSETIFSLVPLADPPSVFGLEPVLPPPAQRATEEPFFPSLLRQGGRLLPFEVNPRTAWLHVEEYGLKFAWWVALLAGVGMVVIFLERKKEGLKGRILFVSLFLGITGWLGLFYGSMTIHDNPDPSIVSIANSYVRYWLPAFVMMSALAAHGFAWLVEKISRRWMRLSVAVVGSLVVVGLGFQSTFLSPHDGLFAVRRTLEQSLQTRQRVLVLTE